MADSNAIGESIAQWSADTSEWVRDCWQDLLDADDRTSPEDYPDMCLITREELAYFIAAAPPPPPDTEVAELVRVEKVIRAFSDAAADPGLWRTLTDQPVSAHVALELIADALEARRGG